MRRDHRRATHLENVVDGRIGGMGNVHDHPQAVHLRHDVTPERAEPSPTFFAGPRRVSDVVLGDMNEANAANALVEEIPDVLQVALEGRAVLHRQDEEDAIIGSPRRDIRGG